MEPSRHADRPRRRWPVLRVPVAVLLALTAAVGAALVVDLGGAAGPAPAARPPMPVRAVRCRSGHPVPTGCRAERSPMSTGPMPVRTLRVPVLMYHRVAPPDVAKSAESRDLTVAPATFAAELLWLHRAGYHPIHMAALYRALYDGAPLPRRPIVITFDDGYTDAVERVLPLLRSYRWPATFFDITGRDHLRGFLDDRQLLVLDRAGMDVASHSVTHRPLILLTPAEVQWELVTSRRMLETLLSHPVDWLAYPFGRFDAATEAAARDAGYLLAFTTRRGDLISTATPFAEPRIEIHGSDNLATFAWAVQNAG